MNHDNLASKRAVYSDEFKRFVVLRLRKKEQSATDLAIELGIRRNQLKVCGVRSGNLPKSRFGKEF